MTRTEKHNKLARNRIRNHEGGFTLIELIMTLAIGAILLTQGIPSFISMIQNNRLVTATNDLVADLNLARSEAITRNTNIVLCRSADPSAATPTCGGTGNTWTTGWLVYIEQDGDVGFDSTDETLLRIGSPAEGSVAILSNNNADADLEYNGDGTLNEAGPAIFAICDGSDVNSGRQINVNVVGRPRLTSAPIGSCSP